MSPDDNDRSLAAEPPNAFDPVRYWEDMHRSNVGFAAVGFPLLGTQFNAWMYRVRRYVLRRALRRAGVSVKGASVLDVGTGTGFYAREWQRLGAAKVTGVDMSATAVKRLRAEIPWATFFEADIAEPIPVALGAGYAIVSAFDVLFHIVDDERYARAIENLGRVTQPGGHLLLSELFLSTSTVRHRHVVLRTRDEIERALSAAGFQAVLRLPMFVVMNAPADSGSRLLRLLFRGISGVCWRSNRAGAVLGAALFVPELVLTAFMREGPTTQLVVCRRL